MGYTPLHLAAKSGYAHIVKLLHKKGALINTKNYRKTTPLHDVADNGYQNIAEYLIQNGAELEAEDGINRTPLNCAVGAFKMADFRYLHMIECLITYGANVNAGDVLLNLHTFPEPIYMATLMKEQKEFSGKGRALEQLLLKYGAKPLQKRNQIELQEFVEKLEDGDKYISIPHDEFFDVMKTLNDAE